MYSSKRSNTTAYAVVSVLLCTALALVAAACIINQRAYAANSGDSLAVGQVSTQAAFAPTLKQVSGNRPISETGFLNVQGVGFDTYTKKDGYSFAGGSDGNKDFKLIHFTMTANGAIKKVKSVKYLTKNLVHGNDATVYQQGGKKYLFVAVSGGTELAGKTSAGKSTKVAVINLAEYNKGIAKVYGATVVAEKGVKMSNPVAKCKFSGITYTGMRTVDKKKVPVFVLKDGRTFYAAKLTISAKGVMKFSIFDSARVDKPTITYSGKKYDSTTQGVTFHNGYLYLSYSGESAKIINNNFLIGRINYNTLFKDTYSTVHKLQVFSKRIDKANGQALSKHVPESVFFRTLTGKDNLYLSFNRATTATKAPDIDCVMRSTQKY